MAEARPGSWEPGFFIEFVRDDGAAGIKLREADLPHRYALRYERIPHPERFPSLMILPWDLVSRLPRGNRIPLICYGESPPLGEASCLGLWEAPYEGEALTELVNEILGRRDFPLPGGYLRLEGDSLVGRETSLSLTPGESRLIRAFLSGYDGFRTYREIEILTERKAVKSLISRLRQKITPFVAANGPVRLDFTGIKGRGYYLGITVENLWKTL